MFDHYTEMDRLILERWSDVAGLIEAHKATQDQIEKSLSIAGASIARWVTDQGFEGQMHSRDAVFEAWKPAWYDKRKDETRIALVLGGLAPRGYRKMDARFPYLWVISRLEQFKMKEPGRIQFSQSLRAALGEAAPAWHDPDVDDSNEPLGRYLREYDDATRARLLLSPDDLISFAKAHLPTIFALADTIDAELQRAGV